MISQILITRKELIPGQFCLFLLLQLSLKTLIFQFWPDIYARSSSLSNLNSPKTSADAIKSTRSTWNHLDSSFTPEYKNAVLGAKKKKKKS